MQPLKTLSLILVTFASTQSSQFIEALDAQTSQRPIARVFILAGQSNMQGHAVVDLDHPEYYNGGKGILTTVMRSPENQLRMAHLLNPDGSWRVRDDAFCWYRTDNELKTGGISIGFAAYGGEPHHFGPEMQFGHVVGDAFNSPILIIKTAWGGKSLMTDFRPPSSGGEVGPFYIRMLEQLGEAMENASNKIPALKNHDLVISGFVWQQGWNDMCDQDAINEYTDNLVNFISDIRKQVGVPDMPFVFGELGNGGPKADGSMKKFRNAQAAVAAKGIKNVAYVKTSEFARLPENSPNQGHGHHWYGNAESYFLLGNALGEAMLQLLSDDVDAARKQKARVLLLGDSISIGYTPTVQRLLANDAVVIRPMQNEKKPENCAGTDNGIANIDRWLKIDGGNWDVIHFNFGLHDLKHVDAETGKNSNIATDPLQTNPEEYQRQLTEIVGKLKKTNARLILCTTTPVPAGARPLREETSPPIYNEIAMKIARENGIEVNDLYSFSLDRLKEIQRPANVHFSAEGSQVLGKEVAKAITQALAK
ncbi:MAG: sialate O-acetylesterase [Mariniblastus sp.]